MNSKLFSTLTLHACRLSLKPHTQIQPSKSRLCQNSGAQGKQEMQVSGQGELEVHLFYWHCSLLL